MEVLLRAGPPSFFFGTSFDIILPMATLVFDIETSAVSLESFDEPSQEYLMRPANNLPTEEEQ